MLLLFVVVGGRCTVDYRGCNKEETVFWKSMAKLSYHNLETISDWSTGHIVHLRQNV